MLTYELARRRVIEEVTAGKSPPAVERVRIEAALSRVLAQEVIADREYPPFSRSVRDGFAVRASDAVLGAMLRCVGEIKAGEEWKQPFVPQTCVQIMTGAAIPDGADAVVMIEHTWREGDWVHFERAALPGQHIVPRGSEVQAGKPVLRPGARLGFAELGQAAQVGAVELEVAKRPRVAVLSTGDEVVPPEASPGAFQIRNSNSVSLAAQIRLAGGEPVPLGIAPDRAEALREAILRGLQEDVLVLSGGVSMGKYDLVEPVLKELGAELSFDAVAIRPGKPTVFGRCGDTFVFGLPGNPVSTMITFELFVVPALDLLSGADAQSLPLLRARLGASMNEKRGVTHFLPSRIEWPEGEPVVRSLRWQGSGDIAAVAQANCFLVVPEDREKLEAGEDVMVLLRRDVA
jgi:molybdopterin molybdotransferase